MATWNTNDGLCEDCRNCCGDAAWEDLCDECRDCNCHADDRPQPTSTQWRVERMNTTIAKLFDKTADAVLVNKYYGSQIAQNDVTYIMLKGKEKDLLAMAQDLQKREDARNHIVTAQIVA